MEERWLLEEGFAGISNAAFFAAREELRRGVPLAYLIGTAPFGPLTLSLASRPLIPRAETEYWVMEVLKNLHRKPLHVLDLCAGSGCIGMLALHTFPTAHVDFTEIDEAHHDTIRHNLTRNNLPTQNVSVYGGDLFAEIPHDNRYDLILSNPPYIDRALNRAQASVKAHEPSIALYGGKDGMEIIARIIAGAKKYLTPQGMLVIEHEPEQCEAIKTLAEKNNLIVEHKRDQYNVVRYSILSQPSSH